MKTVIITAGNKETGQGHYVRMGALSAELQRQGHSVHFVSDRRNQQGAAINYRWLTYPALEMPLYQIERIRPDWLIVDLPGETSSEVYSKFWRTCVIDGIGHPPSNGNINISQGLEGQYKAPEYLIIRPEILEAKSLPRQKERVLVFGGGSDKLKLDRYWRKYCLSYGDYIYPVDYPPQALGRVMRQSEFAVVAMGMVVWELVALGIPSYVFSLTEAHLKSAMAMDKLGYIKAWPAIGLPEREQFFDFVATRFKLTKNVVDGQGASRIVKLLAGAK